MILFKLRTRILFESSFGHYLYSYNKSLIIIKYCLVVDKSVVAINVSQNVDKGLPKFSN